MQYFTSSDYEVLTPDNAKSISPEIVAKRRDLREKILSLHEQIYPEVQKLGLRCHTSQRNLTNALIDRYTGSANNWLFVRYNNASDELLQFLKFPFTAFADIQFGLFYNEDEERCYYEIQLFLGRQDGYDRQSCAERMNIYEAQITDAIAALKGYGLQWKIIKANTFDMITFDLDNGEPSEFYNWLKANDKHGLESFMTCSYAPNDDRISDQNIKDELLAKIRLYLPLYKILTHRG